MDYTLYKAEDFAADESFISYRLRTDKTAIDFWENWISRHPEMIDEVMTAEHLVDLLHIRLPQEEFEAEFNRLQDFIQSDVATTQTRLQQYRAGKPARRNIRRWAVIAFACASAFLIVILRKPADKAPVANPTEWVTTYNPPGQRSTIQLTDGSTIILNANSTLTYPKAFRGETREVKLEGEAFFEIARNPQQPFIVRADKLTTTVLGTKFNIRFTPGKDKIEVALVEGSIKVGADDLQQEVILKPNQQITYSETDKTLTTTAFNAGELLGWTNGTLSFHNASFKEVSDKLYQNYGITLLNESPNKQWSYSGRFENKNYLAVIKSICYAKRLSYTIQQDTVIIR
ncbi:FecR domain-containing protein [Pontibacter sp. Tf4]|uniref:FecR family protein n=1 Tax=Pontibacter sp. Tf4 TaxID=2761620 RepID=UPI0016246196|nr:FecR domain-containing protein [Pontibacter sp. Tf4]MBB6612643.1 FecR domain-containing protein [Pontibacter sp. Tf4]